MPDTPSFAALNALDQLDRTGSVAAAADRLGLTPSAVTHKLKTLEAQMGFALTLRRGRGVTLSPRARQYLQEVRPALAQLDQATRAARGRGLSGALSIAAAPGFAAAWLSPRIARFSAAWPELDLTLSVAGGEPADVSILFVSEARAAPGDRLLVTPEFFPVAAPRLLHGAPAQAGPRGLIDAPLLHLYDRRDWTRWGEAHGAPATRGMTFRDANLMFAAAEAGAGLALGDAITCADALARGALTRAAPGAILSDRSYYMRIDAPGPAATAFADWLTGALAASG